MSASREWLQITAAQGPAECAWVVPRLLREFTSEAAAHGLTVDVLESEPGPVPDTLSSVLLAVEGHAVGAFLASWTGTVLWVAQSPYRSHYKRKNWFVGVERLQMPAAPQWSERDVRVETLRASGPGGQHVNKTESAVRVTHVPSGLSVLAREERSQLANRKLALARLAQALAAIGDANRRDAERQRWLQHKNVERGNPIRTYEGAEFRRRKR